MVNKAGIVVYNLMVLQSTQAFGYVPLHTEKQQGLWKSVKSFY